jgi:hypothetical protein
MSQISAQKASSATTTLDGLSQALRLLLTHETMTSEAVSGIVANPALHAECKAALPGLMADRDRAMVKATIPDIQRAVSKGLMIYSQPERTEGEWAIWWGVYFETLSDMPARSVAEAMRQWLRGPSGFMPKPGELRDAAAKVPCPEYQIAYRAKLAAESPAVTFQPDAAQRKAEAAELLAGFKIKSSTGE